MIVYMLAKYGRDGRLIGRRLLPGLDPQIMRDLYKLADDDPVSEAYPVDASNRDLFELMLGERFDFEAGVYAIEATTINDNRAE